MNKVDNLVVTNKPDKKIWKYLKNIDANHVFGIDKGAVFLTKKNYYMDFVAGDFDNMTFSDKQIIDKYNGEIKFLSKEKDVTDLEYMLKHIGNKEVLAYVSGNRYDHFLTQLNLLNNFDNLTIISDDYEIKKLPKGKHEIANNNDYKYFGLFSIDKSIITIQGAKYNITKANIDFSSTGFSSNEFTEKQLTIEVLNGFVILLKNKNDN